MTIYLISRTEQIARGCAGILRGLNAVLQFSPVSVTVYLILSFEEPGLSKLSPELHGTPPELGHRNSHTGTRTQTRTRTRKDAIEQSFVDGRDELDTDRLLSVIKNTHPLREVMKKKVQEYKARFNEMKIKSAS